MMNSRDLRLAIKAKLDHRRELMTENASLWRDKGRLEARNEFLVKTLGNPLVNMALEQCADEIMQAIIDHAVKASEVVADQTFDSGDYEIGISIPSLHIRRHIYRMDVDMAFDATRDADFNPIPIRRVNYNGGR